MTRADKLSYLTPLNPSLLFSRAPARPPAHFGYQANIFGAVFFQLKVTPLIRSILAIGELSGTMLVLSRPSNIIKCTRVEGAG